MKTPKSNRAMLTQGLQLMAGALGCLFLGPTLVYLAQTNTDRPLHSVVLWVAIIICILGVFLGFKGLKTIVKSLS